MLDYLIHLAGRLGHWGYVVFFLAATLESAAFLGLIVPGESLVLVGGFLASRGLLDLDGLICAVAAGAILGDSIGYELGRRLGRDWLLRHGRWAGLRPAHFERVDAFFARHGGKTVFFGRFIGFLRALAPFVAGSSRMPCRQFLPYNVAGGLLWSAFVLLGYFLGGSWHVAERWIGRASAIAGGLLLLGLALAWLWRWLVRHEADLRQRGWAFLEQSRVLALRRRYAAQIAWLQARFSPRGYLGLHLTLGALALIAAAWVFGGVAEDVVHQDPLVVVDQSVAAWFQRRATPSSTRVMFALTFFGSGEWIGVAALLLALYLLWRRAWNPLLLLALATPGGALLNLLLKAAFHRHRPIFEHPIQTLNSYSFPSGHVMAGTLFYGLLAVLAVGSLRAWRWRVLAVLLAGVIIGLISVSRLALGVHYLSDVLAAGAAGFAWLALCVTAVDTLRRRRLLTRANTGGRVRA